MTRAPEGARVLASSPVTAMQAFSIRDRAARRQFHVEITPTTVSDRAAIPAYAASLEKTLGRGAVAALERAARMAGFNRTARVFYQNFRKVTGL